MKQFLLCSLVLFFLQTGYGQQVVVLGVAQDGGFPHIGCQEECLKAHNNPGWARNVTSLAIIDPVLKKWWLVEATPDITKQLQLFRYLTQEEYPYLPEGVFLTHAHIGHYTGLMYFGREAMDTNELHVYALPKMIDFLSTNGPWSQLIDLKNILPVQMEASQPMQLTPTISIEAFTVPHRDEFSETAGFRVSIGTKGYLFIPDIDKWYKWDTDLAQILRDGNIHYAFLDATFYAADELPNRPMSEVPHPYVTETMRFLADERDEVKAKVKFIHFNHTNPLLFDKKARMEVEKQGFGVAEQGKSY